MTHLHAQLVEAMIAYDRGDVRRIQHFIKVHDFAATIASLEKLDSDTTFILEAAAILHDIGIHRSEAVYGDCGGKHQEELGPAEAEALLQQVGGFTPEQVERICFLIAHHHTYRGIDAPDWQILIEADYLVNSFEDNLCIDAVRHFGQKVFKTQSGKRLLGLMWGIEG